MYKVKKFLKIIFALILSVIVICTFVIMIQKVIWKNKTPNIFGIKMYIVLSGSMEPTINIGDIVFVKETEDIKSKDIISFKVGDSIVTHRVEEVIEDENNEKQYKTKGDANSSVDNEIVKKEEVEGKYLFKIAKLGKVILFLKTKVGIAILAIVLILILVFTPVRG